MLQCCRSRCFLICTPLRVRQRLCPLLLRCRQRLLPLLQLIVQAGHLRMRRSHIALGAALRLLRCRLAPRRAAHGRVEPRRLALRICRRPPRGCELPLPAALELLSFLRELSGQLAADPRLGGIGGRGGALCGMQLPVQFLALTQQRFLAALADRCDIERRLLPDRMQLALQLDTPASRGTLQLCSW
jgi:hypothetical protein